MRLFLKSLPAGIPSAIAILVIAYLSLNPNPLGDNDIMLFNGADKVAHCILYFCAVAAFILDYAKYKLPHHTKLNVELMLTCSAMLLGLLMEIGQLIMSNGRTYDNMDIMANCLGALIAFAYLHVWGLHKFRRFMLHSKHHHHRHHS